MLRMAKPSVSQWWMRRYGLEVAPGHFRILGRSMRYTLSLSKGGGATTSAFFKMHPRGVQVARSGDEYRLKHAEMSPERVFLPSPTR